jgi:hypothetical protein
MAVEVLAVPYWRMVVRGSAWRAAIWTSRRPVPAPGMVVTNVPEHVGMSPVDPDSRCLGEPSEPPGGCMPVHPRAEAAGQDRPGVTVARGAVDGPAGRWGQRDQDDLAAFAADAQDPVAVFFAEVADVRARRTRRDSSADRSRRGLGRCP